MSDVDLLEIAPPPRRDEWAQSPTLPLPPPRDRSELDRFLEELSVVAIQDVEMIRTMFSGFSDRKVLAAVFHESLRERPCGDIGRFMLLLSAIGELADLSSIEPLHNLVWTEDAELLPPDSYRHEADAEDSCSMFSGSGMIQARAVEMFAWIAAGREDDKLLRIVAEHPSVATRLAAADAYLFAYDDADDALKRVLAVARPEDHNGIGVPRLVRGGDCEAFDNAIGEAHRHLEISPPRQIDIRARSRMCDAKGDD